MRNAIARFNQVEGVTDAERDTAWKQILAAAKKHGVDVSEASWRDLAKGGKDRKSRVRVGSRVTRTSSDDRYCQ